MKHKNLVGAIVVAAVLGGGYLLYKKYYSKPKSSSVPTPSKYGILSTWFGM
jgi:hypothetical protein